MHRIALTAVVMVVLAACGGGAESSGDSGIEGRVLAGPQCPVEVAGSPCPDEPVAAEIRITDEDRNLVQSGRSDDDGRFEIAVDPGSYSVEAVALTSGPFPVGTPEQVVVRAHEFTHVNLYMDTGIR